VVGRALRLNEDLVEAIALGHDIGHVPYGHDGEKVLDKICHVHKIGSFSHNVQSARFLKDIEKNGQGLNLTLQVLDGILAHNGEMLSPRYEPDKLKDWAVFREQYRKCFLDRSFGKKIRPMTLEGCVVRICDVVAYIGRDIEDAITVRLIKRPDIPSKIRKVLGSSNNEIINTLVMDLIANSYNKPFLEFSNDIFDALCELRIFNHENIYFNPQIKTQSDKIADMFARLFDKYYDNIKGRDNNSFAYHYWQRMSRRYRRETPVKRAVVDFIAGMTDDFFNNQFNENFVPQSFGYVFKPLPNRV
jgi:dGTPase